MKKIKIIQNIRKNPEKSSRIISDIIVTITGVIALVFGLAQNKIGFIISMVVLILVAITGRIVIGMVISKLWDENKKDID